MSEHSGLTLKSSEAILAVADVAATARFYREVLGFQAQWLWDDPPSFGGVRWGNIHVMFCRQTSLARAVEGHQHSFFCEDVNALHEQHKAAGAPIISEIENKPWGIREYTVRDPSGYHLRFGGPVLFERSPAARATLPGFIRIVERVPTVEEFGVLNEAVGWTRNDQTAAPALRNSLHAVVAEGTRDPASPRVVGSARVVGDGAKFFYVQDVMVVPELQQQRIGTAMMESVVRWLKQAAPKNAFIALFTGSPAFYERHGFQSADGMILRS